MVTSVGKLVDLLWWYQSDCRMKPCVHVTFVHSTKKRQLKNELVSVDYTSKVGEKQFSNVRKRHKFRESKIKGCCSWLAGPTRSPYFAAPSLHVKSVSRNLTELPMPRRCGVKL